MGGGGDQARRWNGGPKRASVEGGPGRFRPLQNPPQRLREGPTPSGQEQWPKSSEPETVREFRWRRVPREGQGGEDR